MEPVDEFEAGWRLTTLYQLRSDHSKVCLFFGGVEYEGLDPPYSLVDGVIRDGDGVRVEFVDPIVIRSSVNDSTIDELLDPELQELEEDGGGYLSNDSEDSDFIFGGEGDKKIIKM